MKRPIFASGCCWLRGRVAVLGVLAVDPDQKRWGATDSETVRDLPGDELLPQGRSTTYAISIAAPPEEVWPWLVQLGHGRGGFYTYTRH